MQPAVEMPTIRPEPLPPRPLPAPGDALRILATDAIAKARAGHPGAALRMADVAAALWTRHLRHDPACPDWWDRDRFVLSEGRAAPLLYALLHLSGYDLPRAELERYAQLGSLTPGSPEHEVTPGVELTCGPPGHGLASAVGMALAERLLAAELNRPGHPVVDHRTFAFLGVRCPMGGLSHEVASLAGALGLAKLVCFWDQAAAEEEAGDAREDVAARFEAYGWAVHRDVDGRDPDDIDRAIEAACAERRRPSLLCCRTGGGAPRRARAGGDGRGPPVTAEEARARRVALGWPAQPFEVPDEVRAGWDARARGAALRRAWRERLAAYAAAHPAPAAELRRRMDGVLPVAYPRAVAAALAEAASRREVVATRKASQDAVGALAGAVPELVGATAAPGGSAAEASSPDDGRPRLVRCGARELGVAAITSGLALHGGFIPFAGARLAASDAARSALRMAALMRLRAVFALSDDAIGAGEEGPAQQPVEQAAALRLIPGLDVWRPCDAYETFVAWRAAVERRLGPSAILLSRQPLAAQPRDRGALRAAERGGYVLAEARGGAPRVVLVATGSEVQLAMSARRLLAGEGLPVRVVSMPCPAVFDRQEPEWRDEVLPPGVPRVVVEAGVSETWWRYAGADGAVVGVDRFGESAPLEQLAREVGLTPERIARIVQAVARRGGRRGARRHQRR